jgi:5-methylcytosine-specific restriction endonuclease McrA
MTTRLSKRTLVDLIFKPDPTTGISEWVSRQELEEQKLLTRNGNQRHGVFFGDNRYIWEKDTTSTKRLNKLRTNGFNEEKLFGAQRPIRPDIHAHHKQMCCVVCGTKSDLVTDHKNDLYNDERVLSSGTQTIDDFQCLCNHCNLTKRQVSVVTRATGKRIPGTQIPALTALGIDFVEGNEEFNPDDVDAMKGTYWYDPIAFIKGGIERLLAPRDRKINEQQEEIRKLQEELRSLRELKTPSA